MNERNRARPRGDGRGNGHARLALCALAGRCGVGARGARRSSFHFRKRCGGYVFNASGATANVHTLRASARDRAAIAVRLDIGHRRLRASRPRCRAPSANACRRSTFAYAGALRKTTLRDRQARRSHLRVAARTFVRPITGPLRRADSFGEPIERSVFDCRIGRAHRSRDAPALMRSRAHVRVPRRRASPITRGGASRAARQTLNDGKSRTICARISFAARGSARSL